MDKQRVLLVDDEQDILDLVSYNLQKEGFEVEMADNGKDGVKKAKKFLPELILVRLSES